MRQGVMRITTLMAVFGQGVLTTGALQAAETPLPAESAVPAKYAAQWNASVNRGIDERIERYRKADWSGGGFPKGTTVRVEQLSHAFQFGSHIFNFDQLGRDDWNARYRATFTNLWNAATVSFYWDRMETKEGEIRFAAGPRDSAEFWKSVRGLTAQEKWERFAEYRRPAPDPVLDFLDAHGLSAHGHLMIYPALPPAWATNGADKATLARRYERRIRQLGAHYGARVPQWDVVNETVDRSCRPGGPFHDKVCWGRPQLLVPEDYTFRCHAWAEDAFPADVKFEINDSYRPIYAPFIRTLVDRGAKIDVVGLQMHIFSAREAKRIADGEACVANGTRWDPVSQFKMLRELDALGRPVHISEITIPAPDDTPEGEAVQARMMRDNYRLWFSWPSVYRITYWNLVDHAYHKENLASGLYTADMRKKRAYHALDRLINREWKTRADVKVREDGKTASKSVTLE